MTHYEDAYTEMQDALKIAMEGLTDIQDAMDLADAKQRANEALIQMTPAILKSLLSLIESAKE